MGNKSSRVSFYGSKCEEQNGKKYFLFAYDGPHNYNSMNVTVKPYSVSADELAVITNVHKKVAYGANYYLLVEQLHRENGRMVQINDGFLNIWEPNVHISVEIKKHRVLVINFLQFLME